MLRFLDPKEFSKDRDLEEKYATLQTQEQVDELHQLLRPYILRRTKADVAIKLPPKSEIIIPVPLSPLQRDVYAAILVKNYAYLNSSVKRSGQRVQLRNVLSQLRKCCNHPYLIPNTEPDEPGEDPEVSFKRLVQASGKLRLLDLMLTDLRTGNHKVLIFSQSTQMLDILQDYLCFLDYAHCRLDGDTAQAERQTLIDRFNSDSSIFCFLLSTRAGGLGINLTAADTIILYDMDFNPQNDLQALARAHRIGQKNRVMVYKLICASSVEERIFQMAKKKLVIDHLVVEKMDDELAPEEMDALLKYGAKELFEEGPREEKFHFDAQSVHELLDRSRHEMESVPEESDLKDAKQAGAFSVARVWTSSGTLVSAEEPTLDPNSKNPDDISWDALLAERSIRANSEDRAELGKGKRRRKSVNYADFRGSRARTVTTQADGSAGPAEPEEAAEPISSSESEFEHDPTAQESSDEEVSLEGEEAENFPGLGTIRPLRPPTISDAPFVKSHTVHGVPGFVQSFPVPVGKLPIPALLTRRRTPPFQDANVRPLAPTLYPSNVLDLEQRNNTVGPSTTIWSKPGEQDVKVCTPPLIIDSTAGSGSSRVGRPAKRKDVGVINTLSAQPPTKRRAPNSLQTDRSLALQSAFSLRPGRPKSVSSSTAAEVPASSLGADVSPREEQRGSTSFGGGKMLKIGPPAIDADNKRALWLADYKDRLLANKVVRGAPDSQGRFRPQSASPQDEMLRLRSENEMLRRQLEIKVAREASLQEIIYMAERKLRFWESLNVRHAGGAGETSRTVDPRPDTFPASDRVLEDAFFGHNS